MGIVCVGWGVDFEIAAFVAGCSAGAAFFETILPPIPTARISATIAAAMADADPLRRCRFSFGLTGSVPGGGVCPTGSVSRGATGFSFFGGVTGSVFFGGSTGSVFGTPVAARACSIAPISCGRFLGRTLMHREIASN